MADERREINLGEDTNDAKRTPIVADHAGIVNLQPTMNVNFSNEVAERRHIAIRRPPAALCCWFYEALQFDGTVPKTPRGCYGVGLKWLMSFALMSMAKAMK